MNHTAWWLNDVYDVDSAVPPQLREPTLWGPNSLALVQAYPNGKTDPGWSEGEFIRNYERGRFMPGKAITLYNKQHLPFAFVMRSLKVVCVDIDGKNGGFLADNVLGVGLPETAAETSKSGNGYHLFYLTDDEWDPKHGFAKYHDRIGLASGIDFRATGCVFHYSSQRWNGRELAVLPDALSKKLIAAHAKRVAAQTEIEELLMTGDKDDILTRQAGLVEDLRLCDPPEGARNNTLFAIGTNMFLLAVPNWKTLVEDKGDALGLTTEEVDKMVRNIPKYATT